MKVYPLKSITLKQAQVKQFTLVDEIMNEFSGEEVINLGDLGCVKGLNKPATTLKVENVLANFFKQEACVLTTGAGTGAIRWALISCIKPGGNILVHKAPIYPTTLVSIEGLNLNVITADFNNLDDIKRVIKDNEIDCCLIQHTRQAIDDAYDLKEVIETIKNSKDIPIVIDDNYAVMKVDKIGCEYGGDLSTFSAFKLLGPEGVGVVVGKKEFIDKIDKLNYSGGSKIQGWQAMEVLRGLVYAPVSLAIQAEQNELLLEELNNTSIPEIKNAFLANSQSKVLLVEFVEPIAKKVLEHAQKMGALPYPVGAESKYELTPLFYKVSGTFLKNDPSLIDTMIRINPNRASANTVLRVLKESIKKAKE